MRFVRLTKMIRIYQLTTLGERVTNFIIQLKRESDEFKRFISNLNKNTIKLILFMFGLVDVIHAIACIY